MKSVWSWFMKVTVYMKVKEFCGMQNMNNFNKQKKADAWRSISISMEIDVKEIKKKMTNLLGSLMRSCLFLFVFLTFVCVKAWINMKPGARVHMFCGDAMPTSSQHRLKTKTARLPEPWSARSNTEISLATASTLTHASGSCGWACSSQYMPLRKNGKA